MNTELTNAEGDAAHRTAFDVDISLRNISRISGPVLVSTMSYTAMGMIDTMMVGRLGVLELGAAGLGNLLTWWLLAFFYGLLSGVNTFVAQAVGARQPSAVGRVLWQAIALGGLSAVFISACWFLAPPMFALTGASTEMSALAAEYSQIRLLGGVGLMALLIADNVYRGLGRTDIPMVGAWCMLVLNCGFNYLLIFGKWGFPALGVPGAALGTIIAQFLVGTGLLLSLFVRRSFRVTYGLWSERTLDFGLLRRLTAVSVPIAVQAFMEMGGVSIFTAAVARLGDVAMASTNAVIQAWSVAYMIGAALAVSATTLVGHCVGAGSIGASRKVVSRIWWIGVALTALVGIFYVGFPEVLMGLFVGSEEDLAMLMPWARPLFTVVVATLFFELRFHLLSGALRGAGDTRYSMLVNIGSAWFVFVPLVLVAVRWWGLLGAWWCLVLHYALMAVAMQYRYRSDSWTHRLFDRADEPPDQQAPGPRERGVDFEVAQPTGGGA